MQPYHYKKMQHINRMGIKFDTNSQGPGDLKLEATYALFGNIQRDEHTMAVWEPDRILAKGGVSFPTGSINKKNTTPAKVKATLRLPMQLGSGAFDFFPGIAYLGESEDWTWNFETAETLRFGLEFRFPDYQSLEGPQLEVDWQANFARSLPFNEINKKKNEESVYHHRFHAYYEHYVKRVGNRNFRI